MPTREKPADKVRLQFDFSLEAYNDLENIQEELGAPSRAETVRYALRTLQWLISIIKDGDATFLVKRKGEPIREVVFPFIKTSSPEIVTTPMRQNSRKLAAVLNNSH